MDRYRYMDSTNQVEINTNYIDYSANQYPNPTLSIANPPGPVSTSPIVYDERYSYQNLTGEHLLAPYPPTIPTIPTTARTPDNVAGSPLLQPLLLPGRQANSRVEQNNSQFHASLVPKRQVIIHHPDAPSPRTPRVDDSGSHHHHHEGWSPVASFSPEIPTSANSPLSSPSTPREYRFVPENPADRGSHPNKSRYRVRPDDQYARQQSERMALNKRLLKEVGGACIRCSKTRKGCEHSKVCAACSQRQALCIRSHDQFWLYATPNILCDEDGQPSKGGRDLALQNAKDLTFTRADSLVPNLYSKLPAQMLPASVVFEIRSDHFEGSRLIGLDLSLLETPLGDRLSKDKGDDLTKTLLSFIPKPAVTGQCCTADSCDLLPLATKMLRLLGSVFSLARSELHAQPGRLPLARVALTFVFVLLAKNIAQLSGRFAYALMSKLRQNYSHVSGKEGGCTAVCLYHRIICGLRDFQQEGTMSEIFSDMTAQIDDTCSLLEFCLTSGCVGRRPLSNTEKKKADAFWSSFEQRIPHIPVFDSIQLSFYPHDENKDKPPVPTVASQQFSPFGSQDHITVSRLLSSDLDNHFPFSMSSDHVSSPPTVEPMAMQHNPEPPEPTSLRKMASWLDPAYSGDVHGGEHPGTATLDTHNLSHETLVPSDSRASTQIASLPGSPDVTNDPKTLADDFFDWPKFDRDQETLNHQAVYGVAKRTIPFDDFSAARETKKRMLN
ncbi:hypothetical protein AJ80_00954 [Polytolypa hystricis UAMH7299]|uniref:Zn(2)-C6 fungal-type domain-containing protein n=1 Tax=Polytolypa hystricis (strain UAMH7299) TaxID=1447883 RepID=A0A2B7YT77_POLH7|nr:hypothetical protein AJ80_00954 [Polytolypa hystricis UAMH7299]